MTLEFPNWPEMGIKFVFLSDILNKHQSKLDSVLANAYSIYGLSLNGSGNGSYWLYGVNEFKEISEPEAFVILGVGIKRHLKYYTRIFPNPTHDLLTIETDIPDHYSIMITSLNGQLISNTKLEGSGHNIDLSSFQKGVYFITISSKDSVTTEKRIKL